MPPKKQITEMQKLREKLRKQKHKKGKASRKVTPEKEARPQRPKTERQIKKALEEENEVRDFFAKLDTTSDVSVVQEIERFAADPKGAWGRARFFQEFMGVLPEKYYKEFGREYIAQDKKRLGEFWKFFVGLPKVVVDIRKKEDQDERQHREKQRKRLEKAEQKRLKKIQADIFGEDTDTDTEEEEEWEEIIEAPPEPTKPTKPVKPTKPLPPREIKVIGPDGKEVGGKPPKTPLLPGTAIHAAEVKNCIQHYRSMPWIKALVQKVYIAAIEGNDITPYIHQGETRQEGDTTWYATNREFILLMCNNHARARTQDGEVLTAFTRKGEPVRMKVAYATNRGFLIQDEKIFQTEKEYLDEQRMTQDEKIKKILKKSVTANVEKMGYQILSEILHKTAPDIRDYGIYIGEINKDNADAFEYGDKGKTNKYDTAYIVKAVQTIAESTKTIHQFLVKLAGVVVYLEMKGYGQDIFRKRVQEEYYLPEMLVNLSPEEKFPEYFDDPRVLDKDRETVAKLIKSRTVQFVSQVGGRLYMLEHPGERIPTKPEHYWDTLAVPKIDKWKSACVNKDDVKDIPDAEVVYYREDDKVYCLRITDIVNSLLFDSNPTNPYTDKPLTPLFLKRFSELYHVELKEEGYGGSGGTPQPTPSKPALPSLPSPPSPTPMLAPNLFNMMVRNIKECEEELVHGDLDKDGKCPSLDGGPSEASKGFDRVVDDGAEVIEAEDDDTSSKDSSPTSTMKKISDPNSGHSPGVVKGDVCQYCKTKVNPKKDLKTKIDTGDELETIYFCSFKCFENHEDWPHAKSRKRKSRKKGKSAKSDKKGGRNSTKERKKVKR